MKVCKMGLESIWINHACGDVRICGWTNYVLGNLLENTIEELWHGKKQKNFGDLYKMEVINSAKVIDVHI